MVERKTTALGSIDEEDDSVSENAYMGMNSMG